MITIIGTGHVFDLKQQILQIFDQKQPDLLCVELDKQRYNGLMLREKDPERYKEMRKNVPIIYKILGKFQENMADEYGVQAGDEMLTTIKYGQTQQIPVSFIDMNVQKLFTKMLKQMTIKEKLLLMLSGFGGFFVSKKRVEKDLEKFEKNFDEYIEQIGEKFPTIKRVLIDERNEFMANNLIKANEQYEKIIALVGDGHITGIMEILKDKNVDFEVIRLSQIRNKINTEMDGSSASFSLEYKDI